ncbi:Uncharacterised protein [Serratia quinivorans]|nr:Uncharacterised protein [Serratia quinivorans]CAI1533052.1 Uncharacterised protein [Serratia quinivorans]
MSRFHISYSLFISTFNALTNRQNQLVYGSPRFGAVIIQLTLGISDTIMKAFKLSINPNISHPTRAALVGAVIFVGFIHCIGYQLFWIVGIFNEFSEHPFFWLRRHFPPQK